MKMMVFLLIENNTLLSEDYSMVINRKKKPDKHIKLPLSEHHIRQIFIYCVDVIEYDGLLPGCAMLPGYSLLLTQER